MVELGLDGMEGMITEEEAVAFLRGASGQDTEETQLYCAALSLLDPAKAKPQEEILPGRLAGFQRFLSERGYAISDDFLPQFFHAYAAGGMAGTGMEALEPVLRPMLVKEPWQDKNFHEAFSRYVRYGDEPPISEEDENRIKQKKADRTYAENYLKQAQENILAAKRREEKLKEKMAKDAAEAAAKQAKEEEKAKKEFAKVQKIYEKLLAKHADGSTKERLLALAQGKGFDGGPKEREKAEDALKGMLKGAISCKDYKDVMTFIRKQVTAVRSAGKKRATDEEKLREAEEETRRMEAERERTQKRLDAIIKDIGKAEQQARQNAADAAVRKQESVRHRDIFLSHGGAVQAFSEGDRVLLDKKFSSLSASDRQKIRDYIRENTRDFRTRLAYGIRTANRSRLDMAETCQKACGTDGIPMRLCFERPVRKQAKLVMFLDVSGSCKEASEMMLTFMYYMQEAFPGGCRTYAFVNSLYDISEIFGAADADSAAQAVLGEIPTRGVYSDYNRPFSDFHENRMAEITSETMAFFIGDARNNKNPTGEEYVKDIARRCRRAYWINTEPRNRWDTADSIMSVYGKYMDRVGEVLTPAALIGFLMGIK